MQHATVAVVVADIAVALDGLARNELELGKRLVVVVADVVVVAAAALDKPTILVGCLKLVHMGYCRPKLGLLASLAMERKLQNLVLVLQVGLQLGHVAGTSLHQLVVVAGIVVVVLVLVLVLLGKLLDGVRSVIAAGKYFGLALVQRGNLQTVAGSLQIVARIVVATKVVDVVAGQLDKLTELECKGHYVALVACLHKHLQLLVELLVQRWQ